MQVVEPRRGPGRPPRAAPPPPAPEPVKPETAMQKLARLDQMRMANSGLLIAAPAGIDRAIKLWPAPGETRTEPRWTPQFKLLVEWWQAIVDAGGTAQDLDRAFAHWRPPIFPGAHPRIAARDTFDAIRAKAHGHVLFEQAEKEAAPARHLANARAVLKRAEQTRENAREELVAAEKLVANIQAGVASLEAQVAETSE